LPGDNCRIEKGSLSSYQSNGTSRTNIVTGKGSQMIRM